MPDDPDPDPFGGIPFLGDLAKMFGQQGGGVPWDAARQMAINVANGGEVEPNVDPAERQRYADMSRIAELHVAAATDLTVTGSPPPVVVPLNRAEWAARTLSDYKPFLESLGNHMAAPPPDDAMGADPMAQLFTGLFQMLGPTMTAMTAGSLVGQLAQRSLGSYDLPLPRPPGHEIIVVGPSLDAFSGEWSVPGDDLRLWICLHELTLHTVLGLAHVGTAVGDLVTAFTDGFRTSDMSALERSLGDIDVDPAGAPEDLQKSLERLLGDPETLLGAMRSPEQDLLQPRLQALVDVLVGYVDHVVETTGSGLIGSYGQLTEALRRRRVTAGAADRFVEKLLGLEMTPASVERGHEFVEGVLERGGEAGLARLWHSAETLPTPNEVDAPGLWLARIDL